jgi:hypothetical protein
VWLELMLTAYGVKATDDVLKELRRDLPRIAAAHRGMQAEPGGKADA